MKKTSLTLFHYRFTFGWLSILCFLGIFGFLFSLGIWQLHRAEEKKQWLASRDRHAQKKPIKLQDLNKQPLLNYVPIELTGHYKAHPLVFLDNKMYRHQVGYQVLVPFVPKGGDQWVWVNRGWIPRGKSRDILPEVKVPAGELSLMGILHLPEKSGFLLGKNLEKVNARSWRLQTFRTDVLDPVSKQAFYPFELWLMADHAGDEAMWVRDWEPKVSVSPERHVGYAVQWFGLAIVFFLVFVILHGRRLEKM